MISFKVLDSIPASYSDYEKAVKNQDLVFVRGIKLCFVRNGSRLVAYGNEVDHSDCGGRVEPYKLHDYLCGENYTWWWTVFNENDYEKVSSKSYKPDSNTNYDKMTSEINDFLYPVFVEDKDTPQYGVELELESAARPTFSTIYDTIYRQANHLIDCVTSDGSVRGGTEIRWNHPTLKNWDKDAIKAVMKQLKAMHFNNKTGTAGMHIHMSVKKPELTRKVARKFLANLDKMKNILYPICARPRCVRGVDKSHEHRYGLGTDMTRGFTCHNTFELRVWAATTNPDVFYARIKFADYFFRFMLKDLPIENFFKEMSKEDKRNYAFLVRTNNPHVFGCGKHAALEMLNS